LPGELQVIAEYFFRLLKLSGFGVAIGAVEAVARARALQSRPAASVTVRDTPMSVPLEQMSEAAEDWYLDGKKIPDLCEEWLWREGGSCLFRTLTDDDHCKPFGVDSKTEESDDESVDGSSFSSGPSTSFDPSSHGDEHMVRVAGQVFTRIESNLRVGEVVSEIQLYLHSILARPLPVREVCRACDLPGSTARQQGPCVGCACSSPVFRPYTPSSPSPRFWLEYLHLHASRAARSKLPS
jgi:hypothetical protein